MKLKNIQAIINAGFVLRLHGSVVNWEKLKETIEYRKLTPSQRKRHENKKMDDVMKAYWDKAVAYVENGDGHPGKLINQSFVHQRINKFHEVKFVLSICVWHAAFTGHESEQIDMY